jgi:phosphate-selective porin OprO and OprP
MKCGLFLALAGAALSNVAFANAQETADLSRAYAAELLADADERVSTLAKPQERFTVNVNGQIQFRYIWNSRSEPPAGQEDDTIGFQARRIKIEVGGKIAQDWGYKIVGAFSRSDGTFFLEDAFGTWAFADGWLLSFGQFKLPFLREEFTSSKTQLAADRSAMNNQFSQGRSQGIMFGYEGDAFRFTGAFSDGFRSSNLDFDATQADFALTARLDYKIAGNWRQFRDFTSFRNSEFASLLGAAVHWESGGDTNNTVDREILAATVDLGIEGSGWNLYAAGVYRSLDPAVGNDVDDYGIVIQGGFFVAEQTELFARWDATFADDNRNLSDFHVITAGLNYYMIPESHAAKFTLDFQYLLDAPADSLTPAASSMRGIGLLASDLDDGQWAIRAQMQILF